MTRPEETDLDPLEGTNGPRNSSTRVKRSGDSDEALGELYRRFGPAWLRSPATGADATVPRIGRFEVVGRLGSGGFGEVLLVHDPRLDRPRAMKVPRLDAIDSGSTRARFFREAKAVAALDHPNVVRVFEADEVGPVCFLIMEYCEGGSLAAWLEGRAADRPLPPRWVAGFVASLADGVEHAHARGLLHRDLKPSNVLLVVEEGDTSEGLPRFIPKVADFGLVKILDEPDGPDRTASDALVGTLAYMAPEQARRDPSGISASTDVYGLGTILHEMLAGRRPFGGPGDAWLIDQILHVEPKPPREGLPKDLETIGRKCLAKAPGDRYPTAGGLAADLRRWLDGEPIQARPSPPWKKARAWSRRHPARVAAAGLVALVVAGGLSWLEARERQAASAWLDRLGVANLSGLPDLVGRRRVEDRRVAPAVARLFASGSPGQKLAAAVFLAPGRPDCASHAVNTLLTAEAEAVKPLASSLDGRVPDLSSRLEAVVSTPSPSGSTPDEREALDRRRSRAATALVLLGHGEPGWRLLRFAPDPQARSFLVHDLGPSGVDPETIFRRLAAEPDPSSRRALIQALGEVPDRRWPGPTRKLASGRLLAIYRDDPDRGIHGSAKWLLKRWGFEGAMNAADDELARRPEADPPAEWRVSKSLLTFVTVPHPERGRLIEVLDTEVTRSFFGRSRPDHRHELALSPEPDCPANSITYYDAAGFCEWLNQEERLPSSYRRVEDTVVGLKFEALPGYLDRPGYRLPTLEESIVACRAGTSTSRYFGDSTALIASYAWTTASGRDRTHPVASLKPNDCGLFDTLGNAIEVGQSLSVPVKKDNEAVLYGGSVTNLLHNIRWDYSRDRIDMNQRIGAGWFGFRIARTRPPTPGRPGGGLPGEH